MSSQNDGGPAFPVPGLQHDETFNGMSMRDYFAAHAPTPNKGMSLSEHCAYRYRYADTMLAARKVGQLGCVGIGAGGVGGGAAPPKSAASKTADADGWIEWSGGECPVPAGTRVTVRFADGSESLSREAPAWDWGRAGDGGDIIAYRLFPHAR